MAEQLVTRGTALQFNPYNRGIVQICDGYYTIDAVVPQGAQVRVGQVYLVYKVGNTYYVGAQG